tara:strand:+ start:334 stop:1662 length:1329 start_codon:yes stop_codon:yes gene_type:complete
MSKPALALMAVLAACGTNSEHLGNSQVSRMLEERTGHKLGPTTAAGTTSIPETVTLDDGVTIDEAIAIALWNNPSFLTALSELGLRRADVVQAGLLQNPQFNLLFPVAAKEVASTVVAPLEDLWLRGKRIKIAELAWEQVSELLVQGGLNLVRDVQVAAAELRIARERTQLAQDRHDLQVRIHDFYAARLRSGAASKLEVDSALVQSLSADQLARQAQQAAELAEQRMRTVLGIDLESRELTFPTTHDPVALIEIDEAQLLHDAMTSRPELRAAQLLLEQEGERVGLAKLEVLRISGIWEFYEEGRSGFESGPGIRIYLPLFDWGQGRSAAAKARLDRAARLFWETRQRIVQQVTDACMQVRHAKNNLQHWRDDVAPALQAARTTAARAHARGHTTLLPVLDQDAALLGVRDNILQAKAALMTTTAQLEWSVGRKLTNPITP